MKESVIYQDILQTGFERGFQIGFERGLQQVQAKIAKIIICFITRSLGNIPEEIKAKIRSLSISELEELADAQFDFTSLDDVMNWLSQFQN
ncbi:MAG: DUF4351 domain-containing protein [Okeania sp. SIO3I5]|uniref:DUF4351 domain-containing protein n=1 Tax=Okeania sp. SIO3I5 TaxID=2607805 RepID=UPI0013BD390E|nr:DUF4351 domain-containing protein [Okeania sp. SIO3I5]NEQ41972.1 DUF4351 domain-containing protein [Okeania sp. SIO3I5]